MIDPKDFVACVVEAVPVPLREGRQGEVLRARAAALASAVAEADAWYQAHGVYNDLHVRAVNAAAAQITALDPNFSMSDVDRRDEALPTLIADAGNLLARLSGRAEHEGRWDGQQWTTWNGEETCHPARYAVPAAPDTASPWTPVRDVVTAATHVRVVAAGHSFNESSCTGGTRARPSGALLSLDRYDAWERVPEAIAQARYAVKGDAARRVVRVQAGKRLRDFTREVWAAGLAMPMAGSTDAQSLGGLLATDLHGTGRDHGFLSETLLAVTTVTGRGDVVTLTRDAQGWVTDEAPPQRFTWLPVAGALGMLGVVVELVLTLDDAYCLEKDSTFVSRIEAERDLEANLARYDHLSFYYPAGVPDLRTIRMNTWRRTTARPGRWAEFNRLGHELLDHGLSAFTPRLLFDIGTRDAAEDFILRELNAEPPQVHTAPSAFARRLFFLHDEIEYGVPIARYREAIQAVLDLCVKEEFKTIIETRFTPDSTQALIGPGTAGRGRGGTAWIELATALGAHSEGRIAQVYERFDEVMRGLGGRPHLGKKTAARAEDMAAMYGPDWETFQALRRRWDPSDRFLPPDNVFLQKVFSAPQTSR
jgi:FAD/FMN-containing dehydrogenase